MALVRVSAWTGVWTGVREIPVPCVRSWHPREASLQARCVLRTSVLLLIRGWEFQALAAGTAMFAVTTHPDHHVQKAEAGHRLGMLSSSG